MALLCHVRRHLRAIAEFPEPAMLRSEVRLPRPQVLAPLEPGQRRHQQGKPGSIPRKEDTNGHEETASR